VRLGRFEVGGERQTAEDGGRMTEDRYQVSGVRCQVSGIKGG